MLKQNKFYQLKECMLPIRVMKNKKHFSTKKRKVSENDSPKPTHGRDKAKLRGMDTKFSLPQGR